MFFARLRPIASALGFGQGSSRRGSLGFGTSFDPIVGHEASPGDAHHDFQLCWFVSPATGHQLKALDERK